MANKHLSIFLSVAIIATSLFWLGQQRAAAQSPCGDYDGDGVDDCYPYEYENEYSYQYPVEYPYPTPANYPTPFIAAPPTSVVQQTASDTSNFAITLVDPQFQAYRATMQATGYGHEFSSPVGIFGATLCMYETFTYSLGCVSGLYSPGPNQLETIWLEYPALPLPDYDPAHNFDGAWFGVFGSGQGNTFYIASATVYGRKVYLNQFDAHRP